MPMKFQLSSYPHGTYISQRTFGIYYLEAAWWNEKAKRRW